ncbi:MAG: dihydrodipicolinate synthase family protein [Bacteroidetes bacterium]|nr:dihydrodipicolinate synthase family protein [Bacteroidota bacterium]
METNVRLRARLKQGMVIPAHPLALTGDGRFSDRHQRALTRYYAAAGAGGLAVGVHTTQFEIRDRGLFRPVLESASDVARSLDTGGQSLFLVAGVTGKTNQAEEEARLATELGYDAGLLSLAAMKDATDDELITHCSRIAEIIPVFGFYLQPAVGGRPLSFGFWRRFMEIPGVVAVKVSPFNRYQTLDVVRALYESGRSNEIALYTGNDDAILADLVTPFQLDGDSDRRIYFSGGLLGHWAFWTKRAVEHLARCKQARDSGSIPAELLTLAAQITDLNAAVFDAANHFEGCVPGINYMLYRTGLLPSIRCLNERESMSSSQMGEVERVIAAYPHLSDDDFVRAHVDEWLRA